MPSRSPKFTSAGPVYNDDVTVAAVSAGPATGNSNAVGSSDWAVLRLNVRNVSFVGGTTPTVTPVLQQSTDGSTGWTDVPTSNGNPFAAVAAGATTRSLFWGLDRFVRIRWTCTGTPTSVSFTVDGEAV